jgi:exo-beta-1,3-glucanase (GH17 family)/cellulose synthase/poly-beta-1,6-N-acetylglucosamine synthase-like glycosyltransferase
MRSVAVVVALAACLHAGVWALLETRQVAPDVNKPLASVSYDSRPGGKDTRPTIEQMRADFRALAPYTRTIRTYASTDGKLPARPDDPPVHSDWESLPAVAAEFGLKVTLGIWLEPTQNPDGTALSEKQRKEAEARNEREIRAGIELARRHSNIVAIVVGNETLYRGGLTVDELIKAIQRVKKETQVPVTTGEIVSSWTELGRDSIRLAAAVDFIAAHALPYWNDVPADQAVDAAVNSYNMLRRAYPGKRVVIAEFGWPSAGYNRGDAMPGRAGQANIIRDFVTRADALGIDYNIIEAFDQPWKTSEGSVGQYWGLFDADHQPKFQWSGLIADPDHWKLGAIAVAVGFLVSLPILAIVGATLGQALLLAFAAHVVGAWTATVFAFWNGHYFVTGSAFALGLGIVLLVPLVLIALARVQEIATVLFGPSPRRLLPASLPVPAGYAPKVSIHVPAHMEPPEMLKATLDSIAALEYPNFECVVVINNTPDPAYWRPVEEHCRTLGERFKFLNVEGISGFKAGALRLALEHSDPATEIIGVVDADYAVTPDWLKDLVPAFADPKVGLVQAPQDHRDGARTPMHRAMCGEYSGFFDIGMVLRNEANAIVVHGTMCLIRKAALESTGGWSSDTICEDTDLGLTLLEQGWLAHYTDRRYGYGLLPDSFEAFKKQRHRWAFGGLQIAKKHCRRLLSGTTQLTREQRREFAMGWLNWLGAESVGVLVALLNLAWVPVVAFLGIAIPDKILTLPIMATFAISLIHFVALYRARVDIPARQAAAAMLAAMAMQWTVARAVSYGLIREHLPFVRTAKGGNSRRRTQFPAFYEGILGSLLVLGATIIFATNYEQVREISLFGDVLLIQSLPFLAAAVLAGLEGSRVNDFAFWRGLAPRLAARLRPARIAEVAIIGGREASVSRQVDEGAA